MTSGWQPGPGDWPSDSGGTPPPNEQPTNPPYDDSYAPGGDGRMNDSDPSPWGGQGSAGWGSSSSGSAHEPGSYGAAPTPFAGTSAYGDVNAAGQGAYGPPDPLGQPAAPYGASGPSVPSAGMPPGGYGGGGGWQGPGGYGGPGGPGGYGAPKSNKSAILWIVLALAVVGVIVGVILVLISGKDDPTPAPTTPIAGPTTPGPSTSPTPSAEEGEYGSDSELDALWDSCAGGDMEACDDLWLASPWDSGYYDFAVTCGGLETESMSGQCEIRDRKAYGDDPAMDALWDSCATGVWEDCDALASNVPSGSEYYEFAYSCGNTETNPGYAGCLAIHVFGYGDDPELDQLYDWCKEGDLGECDNLYRAAPYGTDYRHFGETCGATRPNVYGSCDDDGNDEYGEDRTLDALWDECAAGDTWKCRVLYVDAPYGSEYAEWGDTCGDTVRAGSCWSAGAGTYGSEPNLDALWDSCAAGDMSECDALYSYSPWGTEYEEFARSCGDTKADSYGFCDSPW